MQTCALIKSGYVWRKNGAACFFNAKNGILNKIIPIPIVKSGDITRGLNLRGTCSIRWFVGKWGIDSRVANIGFGETNPTLSTSFQPSGELV